MEYIIHGDLQENLTEALPDDQVGCIVRQVLEGLEFMHENGFAHRDLKPQVWFGNTRTDRTGSNI
jgi:calcium/calmodulin-dependent protein kinase I